MKRRNFLGLFGGAVVAGPSVAKNALETVTPIQSMSPIMSLGEFTDLADLEDATWGTPPADGNNALSSFELKRLDSLRKLIAGEPADDNDAYPIIVAAEMNIHALASVSPTSKVRILRRRMHEIRTDRRKADWIAELMGLEARL